MSDHGFMGKTVEISVDGKRIVLSEFTLLEHQRVRQDAEKLRNKQIDWLGYIAGTTSMIHASMKRAGGSDEDPMTYLNLGSWRFVWDALLDVSGIKAVDSGEAKPATE